jgi:hypothetical protein
MLDKYILTAKLAESVRKGPQRIQYFIFSVLSACIFFAPSAVTGFAL